MPKAKHPHRPLVYNSLSRQPSFAYPVVPRASQRLLPVFPRYWQHIFLCPSIRFHPFLVGADGRFSSAMLRLSASMQLITFCGRGDAHVPRYATHRMLGIRTYTDQAIRQIVASFESLASAEHSLGTVAAWARNC